MRTEKTCNEEAIWAESGTIPATAKGKTLAVKAFEKTMRLDDSNPLKQLLGRSMRNRFKKIKGWRDKCRETCEQIIGVTTRSMFEKAREAPWKTELKADIYTELRMKTHKSEDNETL